MWASLFPPSVHTAEGSPVPLKGRGLVGGGWPSSIIPQDPGVQLGWRALPADLLHLNAWLASPERSLLHV